MQRGRGRPSKLTPDLLARMVSLVKTGLPIELAAEDCGVSRRSVLEWVQRGEGRDDDRPADPLYVDFANRYRQARAEFALGCQQTLLEVMLGWRPSRRDRRKRVKSKISPLGATIAKWHLARRFPEFWGTGREARGVIEALREADAPDDGPPQIQIILAPDAEEPDAPPVRERRRQRDR